MSRTPVLAAYAVACLALFHDVGIAQARRPTGERPAPGSSGSADQPAPNPNVTVGVANVRRDAAPAAPDQAKKRTGLGKLAVAVGVDKEQDVISRQALFATVRPLLNNKSTTVVVVGNAEDRDRVVTSLAEVRRLVHVVFIDAAYSDATYDNGIVNRGPESKAANVRVFYPDRVDTKGEQPDARVQSKAVSVKVWTGLFGANGDAFDVGSPTSRKDAEKSTGVNAMATGGASAPAAVSANTSDLHQGDVVIPKLNGAKLHETEVATSKAVGNAKTSEPLVILEVKEGMARVENANVSGWINVLMLTVKR